MKQGFYRLSWYMLTLLVLLICIVSWQAAGQAEEQPPGETSGGNRIPSKKTENMSKMFEGTVMELIDAGRQFYVRIETGGRQVWVAVPSFDGKPGDRVIVPPGVPVADFQSKKLNRFFKMIYFVGSIHRLEKSD